MQQRSKLYQDPVPNKLNAPRERVVLKDVTNVRSCKIVDDLEGEYKDDQGMSSGALKTLQAKCSSQAYDIARYKEQAKRFKDHLAAHENERFQTKVQIDRLVMENKGYVEIIESVDEDFKKLQNLVVLTREERDDAIALNSRLEEDNKTNLDTIKFLEEQFATNCKSFNTYKDMFEETKGRVRELEAEKEEALKRVCQLEHDVGAFKALEETASEATLEIDRLLERITALESSDAISMTPHKVTAELNSVTQSHTKLEAEKVLNDPSFERTSDGLEGVSESHIIETAQQNAISEEDIAQLRNERAADKARIAELEMSQADLLASVAQTTVERDSESSRAAGLEKEQLQLKEHLKQTTDETNARIAVLETQNAQYQESLRLAKSIWSELQVLGTRSAANKGEGSS